MEKKLNFRWLRVLPLIATLLLMSFSVGAQTITGKVTDENGDGLVGVNIVVKNTTAGTISDINGDYQLTVPEGSATLVFSSVGYLNKEVEIAGQTTINVQMDVNEEALEEVVVVGYGTVKKKLATGANLNVKGEEIQALNTATAMDAMKGITPGISITQTNAQPGAGTKVYIRGIGTIGNSSPLYVVDGVIQGNIDYLSPNDIESVDVLKDAASSGIYGSRAANGVILVTTKGGKKNMKPVITYNGYQGWQNVYKKPDLLNAKEYMTIMDESVVNAGLAPHDWESIIGTEKYQAIENGTWNGTNWFNEMMVNDAYETSHSLNITGGSERSVYSIGASYFNQDGVFGQQTNSFYKRINLRLNTEHILLSSSHDILKIGENITYTKSKNGGVRQGNIYWNDVHNALVANPFISLYDETGEYGYAVENWDPYSINPAGSMDYSTRNNENDNNTIVGSVYLDFQPIKGLTYKTRFGVNAGWSSWRSFSPAYQLGVSALNTLDKVNQGMSSSANIIWDNTLTYVFSLNDQHHFTVLAGQSMEKQINSLSVSGTGVNYIFDDFAHAYLSNTSITVDNISSADINGTNFNDGKMLSYFGRVSYDFKETYLLTLTLRADGSSNFPKENRWGVFPSVAAGWVVSNESFMSGMAWMDYLKLRGSWGQVGNSSIGNFWYSSTIRYLNSSNAYNDAQYYFSDDKLIYTVGGYPARLPNLNIGWETSETLDFGLDANFLNARLQLAFDWYKKDTKDWLLFKDIEIYNGFPGQEVNGGQITNQGIELSLSWNDKIGEIDYGLTVSLAHNKNEVTAIDNSERVIHGPSNVLSQGTGEIFRAQVGYPVGYFWGYETDGVIQNDAEAAAWVRPTGSLDADGNDVSGQPYYDNQRPGDLRFVDQNQDGVIDEDDRVEIGDPNPDYILGLQLHVAYKGISLSATANGAYGHQIAKSYRSFADSYKNNYTTDVFSRWHGEGTSNTYPRLSSSPHRNQQNLSDVYIHDANFLRISNITLGYDFKQLFQGMPLSEARLYFTAKNLYTFTKYNGMDPEVGTSSDETKYSWGSGIDLGLYPAARTFLIGVSLKF